MLRQGPSRLKVFRPSRFPIVSASAAIDEPSTARTTVSVFIAGLLPVPSLTIGEGAPQPPGRQVARAGAPHEREVRGRAWGLGLRPVEGRSR